MLRGKFRPQRPQYAQATDAAVKNANRAHSGFRRI
jgi:hypothetical protein